MLFRYLRGRMNGAFLLGKEALCHQFPISMLTRSIQEGPELPGSMQCSFIERVLWQVLKSLEKLTTVKLKQNREEGLMELLQASRLARQIRAFLRG